jgi:hypothetical protein
MRGANALRFVNRHAFIFLYVKITHRVWLHPAQLTSDVLLCLITEEYASADVLLAIVCVITYLCQDWSEVSRWRI